MSRAGGLLVIRTSTVEILCSSRELFGADRSALRLATALTTVGLSPVLVLPVNRPELGLCEAAERRGIRTREEPIAIASSGGVESPSAFVRGHHGHARAQLTIFNTTAVLGSASPIAKKIVIVREWLEPKSIRHRVLAARHRLGADAIVGVSADVVAQWRRCVSGPKSQYVVHNWLDQALLDKVSVAPVEGERSGILCIGRFNRWKGQDVLASAYEEAFAASSERPPLRLVGAQPGTKFDDQAQRLASRGERFGWEVLPFTSDPSPFFWSSALVVVPSLQPEPFGTVVLEALAHGCRVLAFTGGGPSDMALDFPEAVELVARDTSALAAALTRWWQAGGRALSGAESSQIRHILDEAYSPDAGARSWDKIIDGLA
jgi:glycosyltransferase involved in cell wall biosynthesis